LSSVDLKSEVKKRRLTQQRNNAVLYTGKFVSDRGLIEFMEISDLSKIKTGMTVVKKVMVVKTDSAERQRSAD